MAFLQRACDRGLKWFVRWIYSPVLDFAIDNRFSTIALAVGFLLLALGVVRSGITPFELFPKIYASRLLAKIVFPYGTPASVT